MERFLDKAGLERAAGHLNSKLAAKQDKLAGKPGQVVGFDETGQAVAQEMPDGGSGTSPYEYAVAGGYKGTEEEFQAALAAGPWIPAAGRLLGNGNEVFNDVDNKIPGGSYCHVEGVNNTAYGFSVHVEGTGDELVVSPVPDGMTDEDLEFFFMGAHMEGFNNVIMGGIGALGSGAHVEGCYNRLNTEDSSDADMGGFSDLSVEGAHIEGNMHKVTGAPYAHIEGSSHAVMSCWLEGLHVSGVRNTVKSAMGGYGVAVFGAENTVKRLSDDLSYGLFMAGYGNLVTDESRFGIRTPCMIAGCCNNEKQTDGLLIVGGGELTGPSTADRANCFRVTRTQVFGGTYKSSGADYAELFEWLDGNPGGEDRAGRFVTLEGDKLRLARPGDGFVLGIVSGNPSIVGDVHDDQWQGMYLRDVFGRPVWEDIEVPEETREVPDPDNPGPTKTVVTCPARTQRVRKVNPAYHPDQPYLPRSERPEWDAVGMMGKLVAVDDGTCRVNGWCTAGEGGAATHSNGQTRYRVMARLDEGHVQVLAV